MDGYEIGRLHELYETAMQAVLNGDYDRLFWIMHERQGLMDGLYSITASIPASELEGLMRETERLHQCIHEHTVKVAESRTAVLRTAEARRSYTKMAPGGRIRNRLGKGD